MQYSGLHNPIQPNKSRTTGVEVVSMLMATGSLFLDIDSSGGINSALGLTPLRNLFPLDEKAIPAFKIEVA